MYSTKEDALKDWDQNHRFIRSNSVVDGVVAVHKDTNEPCAMNPCRESLRLQDLGIDMGGS
jgi:hypothetical protein